jgi:hypothetical protein
VIEILFFISVVLLAAVAPYLAPNTIRFDLKTGMKGNALIFGMVLVGFALWHFVLRLIFPDFYNDMMLEAIKSTAMISAMSLMRVWWEDVAYVWSSLILKEHGYEKLSWVVIVLSVPSFVFGHLYQGPMGLMSVIFPFMARHLGLKYGAITVVMWHIMYDLAIHFRIQLTAGMM